MRHSKNKTSGSAKYLWLKSIVVFVISISFYATCLAGTSDIQLEIKPLKILLAQEEPSDVLIIARNTSSSLISNLQLKWLSDTDVAIRNNLPNDASIQPNGTLAWSVRLTQDTKKRTDGSIFFMLHYDKKGTTGIKGSFGVALATLEVQSRPPDAVNKMAEVVIESALDEIQEQRSGDIYLVVKNISNVPITLAQIKGDKPDFITLDIPSINAKGLSIDPQKAEVLKIPVKVGDKAHPSKQRIVFTAPFSWIKSGQAGSGSLIVPYTVNVNILGESDLLKLLGVPSLFFMPGFLMLEVILILLKRVTPAQKKQVEFSASEVILISVTLSLVAALLYPHITGTIGQQRNYLTGYGLKDIYLLWFGSITIGLVFWSAMTGCLALINKYKEYKKAVKERQRMPSEKDSPIEILKKLSLNNIKFPLTQVKVRIKSDEMQCFLISSEITDKAWVAPHIIARKTETVAHEDQQQKDREKLWFKKLTDAANINGHPDSLANAISEKPSGWAVTWGGEKIITCPTQVDKDNIEQLDTIPTRLFIEIE